MNMLLALVLAVQAAPVPAGTMTFGDWAVACDNGRRCQAVGLMPEGGEREGYFTLIVERGPEAGAPARFILSGQEQTPALLSVDGAVMPVRIGAEGADFTLEPSDPAGFVRTLIAGNRLQLQGAAGTVARTASLSGLSAALLYTDGQQRRVGTRTALVRPGPRPAEAMPPPPRLPRVRLAPRTRERPLAIPAARMVQLRRQARCTIDDVGGPDLAETAALGGGRTLILLACGSGAYNVSYVPFVARRRGRGIAIDPAPFDTALAGYEREDGRRTLINAAWNAPARMIEDFSKARGLGDCGTRSSHGWDGQRFRLIHREEMSECRGSTTYLTIWRADVRR